MRKFNIFLVGITLWLLISIALVLFAGIGIFMLFMTLSSIIFAIMLCNPAIFEWIRGEKYTQEQRNHFSHITSSTKNRLLFVVNLIIFLILTIILLFYNFRLIDLIGK